MSRYSDEQVDAAIAEFRAGGELLPEEIYELLTPAQRQRVMDALDREEWAALGAWQAAWWAGQTDEIPPTGVWSWSSAPDDLRDLDVQ